MLIEVLLTLFEFRHHAFPPALMAQGRPSFSLIEVKDKVPVPDLHQRQTCLIERADVLPDDPLQPFQVLLSISASCQASLMVYPVMASYVTPALPQVERSTTGTIFSAPLPLLVHFMED